MKNNQGHRDLQSRNKASNLSLRQGQDNFKETTNQCTSLKKNESLDQLDSQKYAYEFDWATHIQITTRKIVETCINIIVNCQKQMHATIIYMGYQSSANQIVADLNKRSEGLAKLVTSPRQIVETYQSSNSKTKIFVYWSSDKNVVSRIKENWIPSFVDLVINYSSIEQKNLDSYECRIRRKVMQKQQFKLQGIVVDLFYIEREANSMNAMLMSKQLNAIILKQHQLGNLSSYFKQQARNSVLAHTKSSIELQKKQEKTNSKVLGTATKLERSVRWAKYVNVSLLDSENKISLIRQIVQFNNNKFRCAIIYTKNFNESQKLNQLLCSSMPIKLVNDSFDLKTKLAELQKGQIRILMISNSTAWWMRQTNVPQNVDLIINSAIPEDSKELTQRITKNAYNQNKDAQKQRKGVIITFLENSPNQNDSQRESLSKFLSENYLEAEQLQTDQMGKDWCYFWGEYSKSGQAAVPKQIISEPQIVVQKNKTTQQYLTQNQVSILGQFESKNQEKQNNLDLKWTTFLQAKIQQTYRINRCKNYILTNMSHYHSCVVYVLNQNIAKRNFDNFDQSLQNVTSVIKGNSQSKTTNDYFQKLREGSIKVLIIVGIDLSEQWLLPSCVDLIINYGLPMTVQQLERRLRKQRHDQVEYRGVVMNIVNSDQVLLLQQFSKKYEIPVDTSYEKPIFDFKHLFSSVKKQQKPTQLKGSTEKQENKASSILKKNSQQIQTKLTNKIQIEDQGVKIRQKQQGVKAQNKGGIRSSHSSDEEHIEGQQKMKQQDKSQKEVATVAQDGINDKKEKVQQTDIKRQSVRNANTVNEASKITQQKCQVQCRKVSEPNVQQQTQQEHQSMEQEGQATADDKQIRNNTLNISTLENSQQPKVQLVQSSNSVQLNEGVLQISTLPNLGKDPSQIQGNNTQQSIGRQLETNNEHNNEHTLCEAKAGDNKLLQGVNEDFKGRSTSNYSSNNAMQSQKDLNNIEGSRNYYQQTTKKDRIKDSSNSKLLDQQNQSVGKIQQKNNNERGTTQNQPYIESSNHMQPNNQDTPKLEGNQQSSRQNMHVSDSIEKRENANSAEQWVENKKGSQQNKQANQPGKSAQIESKKQVESGSNTQNETDKVDLKRDSQEQQHKDQKKQQIKQIKQPTKTGMKKEQKEEQKQQSSQQNITSGLAVQPQLMHQNNLHNLKKQQQNEFGAVLRSTLQANNSSIATLIESKLEKVLETQLSVQTDVIGKQIKRNKQQVSNNMRLMGQQLKEEIKQANANIIQQQKLILESAQIIKEQVKQIKTQNTNILLRETAQLNKTLQQIVPKQQQAIKLHTTHIQSSIQSSTTRVLQESIKLAKSTHKQLADAIIVNQNGNTEKIIEASTTSKTVLNSIQAKQDELMKRCQNIQDKITKFKEDVTDGQQTARKNITHEIITKIADYQKQVKNSIIQEDKNIQLQLKKLKKDQQKIASDVENIPKSIANAAQNISKDVTQSIKKCSDSLNTLGTLQSQSMQAMNRQNNSISAKIAEKTNTMMKDMSALQKQIDEKRNRLTEQQNRNISVFNAKIEKKQKSETELKLENELKELKMKYTENLKQQQKLRQEKAQSVIINTELYQAKRSLKEEKVEKAKLQKQVTELTNSNNEYKKYQNDLSNNYIAIKNRLKEQINKFKQQQQVNAQLRTQVENLSKQITDAKMELANVCQLRTEKTTNKSVNNNPIIPSVQNKSAVANIAENSLSQQVWTTSTSQLIKKYISSEKRAIEELKPKLYSAAKAATKSEESISQSKELKQLMESLESACKSSEKNGIFVYLKPVIERVLTESESLKRYQTQCHRYIDQLESGFKKLAQNSENTLTKGSQCSVAAFLNEDRKESIANGHIKTICGVLNELNRIRKVHSTQLQKANKSVEDLKKASQIQKTIIQKLDKAKKEIQTKFEILETNANQQKSTLQKVRAQLSKNTIQFEANQANYLKTIAELTQDLDKANKDNKKALADIQIQKKKGADAAIESQKQLERVKIKTAQLRTQNTEMKKKYDKDIQEANKKYKDLENKSKDDLKQLQHRLNDEKKLQLKTELQKLSLRLKNEKELQLQAMKNSHDEAINKINQQILDKQKKTKTFEDAVNKQFKQILGQEVQINSDNCEKSLNTFVQQYKQKQGKVLFLPESEMYQQMDEPSKKFIYDNIIRVVSNKRILATKTLFTAKASQDWSRWRYKILDKPNILVMLTLENNQQVGGFSENPYSQTDRRSTGKGYLMSITNKKCYDVKRSCEGKVATYHTYSFIFGNNEFIIKDNMKFQVLIGKRYQHFMVGDDNGTDFVQMEDENGCFKEIQFHQIIFDKEY